MKFLDTIKISLHNMWNNKTRTLLVTLVLFVLSTLVTVILGVSINVIQVVDVMSNTNQLMDLEFTYYDGYSNITYEEIETYKKAIGKSNVFIHTCVRTNNDRIAAVDTSTNIFDGVDGALIGGRFWNKTDKNMPYCWVTEDYSIRNNVLVGDVVNIDNNLTAKSQKYEVIGIVKNVTIGYDYVDVLLDMQRARTDKFVARSLYFYSSYLSEEITSADIKEVGKIINANNKYSDKNPNGIAVNSVYIGIVKTRLLIAGSVLGAALVLSIIVILLCIGCVSNSIQITVEQNRKFFGMMKAIGLRNATIKRIVRWQSVFMIILSVIGSSLVGMGVMAMLRPQVAQVFYTDIPFTLPVYVPFIVLFLLVSLVLIFTTKSLNKISKMDVVSVISEVN